jgi:hypothetical protein
LKIFKLNFFTPLFIVLLLSFFDGLAQDGSDYEKQLWMGTYFNWKLDDKWVYNQDFGYQHSYETPTFTRFSLRSQINREVMYSFSLHGGVNFFTRSMNLIIMPLKLDPGLVQSYAGLIFGDLILFNTSDLSNGLSKHSMQMIGKINLEEGIR